MQHITVDGYKIEVITKNTVVVGAGAAGFNATDRLYGYGTKDIAMICEDTKLSTSRNTGSDKQTYYKLTLSGEDNDSIGELAQTLMKGQCVDGDIALAEAANSAQGFLKLCELGVPFPSNKFGEYIGYKTDHDPRRRATSAGPLTSKLMTECLERSVFEKGIKIYSGYQVIAILSQDEKVYGLLCLNICNPENKEKRFIAFNCKNVIFATGGPAGMYADSVYPIGQYGSTGIAFEAGAKGKNLTEWQYGLASIAPRWNVSGTYMQVLPRFISTDNEGNDEREFLKDFFTDKGDLLNKVFLKGYEWPFDVRKVEKGSSIIDILVYIECFIKGRRVYLDFRKNPFNEDVDFTSLSEEAYQYLDRAGALFGNPIDRLIHMNAPAYDFYLNKNVDLKKEPLEIALCAQHNNGGLAIDCWWQTNIEGLFAAGEVSASHGVYRPGGSALNAGQVGSARAALYISKNRKDAAPDILYFEKAVEDKIAGYISICECTMGNSDNVSEIWESAQARMSKAGAAIRDSKQISEAANQSKQLIESFKEKVKISSAGSLSKVYRLYDMLISQFVYLSAMSEYINNGGKSRGSALYSDPNGKKHYDNLDEIFRFTLDDGKRSDMVQEANYRNNECHIEWRKVRPIPKEDDFFENVWRSYRENGNVY